MRENPDAGEALLWLITGDERARDLSILVNDSAFGGREPIESKPATWRPPPRMEIVPPAAASAAE